MIGRVREAALSPPPLAWHRHAALRQKPRASPTFHAAHSNAAIQDFVSIFT
jgi:hypothetical protein